MNNFGIELSELNFVLFTFELKVFECAGDGAVEAVRGETRAGRNLSIIS